MYRKRNADRTSSCIMLTTYPQRFQNIKKTLASLILQTVRSDIYLVLFSEDVELFKETIGNKEFLQHIHIVESDRDTKSYKKIDQISKIPANYDAYIICDDDVFYPPKFSQRLIKKLNDGSVEVVCGLAKQFVDLGGEYEWKDNVHGALPENAIMIGAGGTAFSGAARAKLEQRLDQKFLGVCPNNDDLWISLILFAGCDKFSLNNGSYFNWILDDPDALYQINIFEGRMENELTSLLKFKKLEGMLS